MKSHNANLIVYFRQPTSSEQHSRIQGIVGALQGVTGTRFSPRSRSMMQVDYDPSAVDSQRILRSVSEQGFAVRLVGM